MDAWVVVHLINRVLEAAPILPFACACLRRQHIPYRFRLVFYYVAAKVVLFPMDTLSRITIRNNVYLFHLSTVLMVVLLAGTYQRLLPAGRVHQLIRLSIGMFLVVALLDATVLNGFITDVNSYAQALGCTILVTLALLHVVYLTRSSPFELEKQPEFFFSVAILVYCSCSVVTYAAINIIYSAEYYDVATIIRLDTLLSSPDTFLAAVHMALFAWMFRFFPISVSARAALPRWLHYSSWRRRPYWLLGQQLTALLPASAGLRAPSDLAKSVHLLQDK
ncbi:hypothetical protein GCM10011375_29500 [Hymenobacter qilianensis]|uniref:Uncharacterized protein n=2 Tax=Hymenobacter qilianensis TaxID=1385715 RepID=A0ACB5PUD0_9BACT|nr:hypothetical protein [Hymenobacter qilianensis]QNP51725.1 hypothetical protein H9L05_17435 [Hymenobacter qilianensis]GGF72466.1 hypothetical protein GCM10011375_29500 [Hymenobacter qilianensis]